MTILGIANGPAASPRSFVHTDVHTSARHVLFFVWFRRLAGLALCRPPFFCVFFFFTHTYLRLLGLRVAANYRLGSAWTYDVGVPCAWNCGGRDSAYTCEMGSHVRVTQAGSLFHGLHHVLTEPLCRICISRLVCASPLLACLAMYVRDGESRVRVTQAGSLFLGLHHVLNWTILPLLHISSPCASVSPLLA